MNENISNILNTNNNSESSLEPEGPQILDKKILCPFEECNNDIRVKLSENKAKCDKCNKEFFYIQFIF